MTVSHQVSQISRHSSRNTQHGSFPLRIVHRKKPCSARPLPSRPAPNLQKYLLTFGLIGQLHRFITGMHRVMIYCENNISRSQSRLSRIRILAHIAYQRPPNVLRYVDLSAHTGIQVCHLHSVQGIGPRLTVFP